MKPVLGFIGLGIMGKPIVKNLLDSGYTVHVLNRSKASVIELEGYGAIAAETPQEVAEKADITFTMVPNTPDVQEVILGENGVIHSLQPEKVVIDMSTISASVTKEIAEEVKKTGANMLDAPCSGGEKGAIEGTLSIMVGGEKAIFEQCKPVFEVIGKNVVYIGGSSSGQVVKSCNQVLAAATLAAMGEALVLGSKAGVDPEKIVQVLGGGAARCWALEVRAPHVLERDFNPGFKSKLQYKDLGLAMELSKDIDSPMPLTGIVHELYKSSMAMGLGEEDHSTVVRVLEQLAGVEVKKGIEV